MLFVNDQLSFFKLATHLFVETVAVSVKPKPRYYKQVNSLVQKLFLTTLRLQWPSG